MTDYECLLFDQTDSVATITLNRAERSNAFDERLIRDLIDALKRVERDSGVRAVVIAGAGRNFCAGQDLGPLRELYETAAGVDMGDHVRRSYNVIVARVRAMDKPVIAAIHGAAAGAGLGLACACDLRCASEDAVFRTAFIGIGLAPDSGISYLLPRIVGLGRATEMVLTNDKVDAQTALEYGLVNRLFKPEELASKTHELAVRLAQSPTQGIGLAKRALNHGMHVDFDDALEFEAMLQQIAGHTADHVEGVRAFVEKRPPKFQGR